MICLLVPLVLLFTRSSSKAAMWSKQLNSTLFGSTPQLYRWSAEKERFVFNWTGFWCCCWFHIPIPQRLHAWIFVHQPWGKPGASQRRRERGWGQNGRVFPAGGFNPSPTSGTRFWWICLRDPHGSPPWPLLGSLWLHQALAVWTASAQDEGSGKRSQYLATCSRLKHFQTVPAEYQKLKYIFYRKSRGPLGYDFHLEAIDFVFRALQC